MIIALLFEVFIKAFLLLILLYIVARDEADFEFRKVTMVTAGIVLGTVIIDAVLTRFIGLFTLIPIAAFIVFMVMQFCWVRFGRSLLVAIPFLVLNIMISTSVASFQKKADAAIGRGLQGPVDEEDMKEVLAFFNQQTGGNAFQVPSKTKLPETEPTLNQILLKALVAGITSRKIPKVVPNKAWIVGPPNITFKVQKNKEKPVRSEQDDSAELASDSSDWQEAGKKLSVKGALIGRDGVRVAIVNNQMVKEGECVQVEHKKIIYRWRASVIRENKVSWEPVEALKK